jgi:aspartyl-tRNA(Asn)/glutamyl-tRNA(Gln) amidotransferase subunit C
MDVKDIRHVAELAELSLTEDEEKKMADEIGRIVAYVKELDAVDTSGVEATAHVGFSASGNVVPTKSEQGWRADDVVPGLSNEDALRGAPRADDGGFVVPKFVGS